MTRRELLKAAGAAGALAYGLPPAFAAGPTPNTAVDFDVPRGDCHVHVVPDAAQFPMAPTRVYTPPPATAKEPLALQEFLHLDRVVIVTPSIYAADNRPTFAGHGALTARRPAVVFIDG